MRTSTTFCLLLAACHTPRSVYIETYADHTEKLELFDGLGTALKVHATYLSPTFRASLADERARLIGLAADDHGDFKARLLADGEHTHQVVFTAESSYDKNDLAFGEDDAGWRIRLLADGEEQTLIGVHRRRDLTVLDSRLFDDLTLYNQLWVATFDKVSPAPRELVLHVGSGHGNGSVTWTPEQMR